MQKRIVIKLGGSSLQNAETLKELSALVNGYQQQDYAVVVVHGGGPAINEELTSRNISWQFIEGQRQTTPEMMTVIDFVLATKVNSMVVENLKLQNIKAVGLSGAANNILICSQLKPELMQVGQVDQVDALAIETILNQVDQTVPVIAPIGLGKSGEKYNVNADVAATKIAMALNAEKLIFLTDQNGILDQNKQLVSKADAKLVNSMIADGTIHGGMFTKVKAMMTALDSGVKQVRVLHASSASQAYKSETVGTTLTNNLPHERDIHGSTC